MGELKVKDMQVAIAAPPPAHVRTLSQPHLQSTRFSDLTLRLGARYLYCHQGTCEHTLVFTDVRYDCERAPAAAKPHMASGKCTPWTARTVHCSHSMCSWAKCGSASAPSAPRFKQSACAAAPLPWEGVARPYLPLTGGACAIVGGSPLSLPLWTPRADISIAHSNRAPVSCPIQVRHIRRQADGGQPLLVLRDLF